MARTKPQRGRSKAPRYLMEKSAGAIVFHRTPRIEYLLICATYWEFPKGRIDADESETAAALREVFEETGLRVKLLDGFRRHTTYFFRRRRDNRLVKKQVVYFLGEAGTREVQLSDEHQEKAWLGYADALARLKYEGARELLRQAHAFLRARQKV